MTKAELLAALVSTPDYQEVVVMDASAFPWGAGYRSITGVVPVSAEHDELPRKAEVGWDIMPEDWRAVGLVVATGK